MNQVAAVQHEAWATLGFLRGVSSLPLSGQAFCTPQWVQLMMEVITGASPLNKQDPTGRSLLKQVNAMSCHVISCVRVSTIYFQNLMLQCQVVVTQRYQLAIAT